MPAVMKKSKQKPDKKKARQLPLSSPKKIETPKSKKVEVPQVKKIKRKHTFDPLRAKRGVVYINHIPHGFYEDQLKKYFTQFGDVTRVRVARSENTGKSKGYAFVEFRIPEVAQVAAETMDNYLMFKKILKTAYIPPENQKYNLFRKNVTYVKGPNGEMCIESAKTKRMADEMDKRNADVTDEQHRKCLDKSLLKLKKQQQKLAAMNIDVNLNNQVVQGLSPKAVKLTKKALKEMKKKLPSDQDKSWITVASEDTTSKKRKLDKGKSSKNGIKKDDKKEIGLSTLLEKTIDSEDSEDDDYIPMDEVSESDDIECDENAVEAQPKKKQKSKVHSLSGLLNETIEDESTSDDEDYAPVVDESEDSLDENYEPAADMLQDPEYDSTNEEFNSDFDINDSSDEDENVTELPKKGKKTAKLSKKVKKMAKTRESSDDESEEVIHGKDLDEEDSSDESLVESPVMRVSQQKNRQNDTLDKLLNETIDGDDSDDSDYEIEMDVDSNAEEEIDDDSDEEEEMFVPQQSSTSKLSKTMKNNKKNVIVKSSKRELAQNRNFGGIKKAKEKMKEKSTKLSKEETMQNKQLKKAVLSEILQRMKSPVKKFETKKKNKK